MLSAFWCPANTIHLEANSTGAVEIQFLPFDVGHRQCSILFINDKIGEFLYCIEANATLPLPSPMPVAESPHSIRISSAAAARSGRGAFGGDERVVYWKCEQNESFTEDLYIPLVNEARENALGEYLKIICVILSFISRLHFDLFGFPFHFLPSNRRSTAHVREGASTPKTDWYAGQLYRHSKRGSVGPWRK